MIDFYHEIYKLPPSELSDAVKRIIPRIEMREIHDIVSNTEEISDIRKENLINALDIRYNQILLPAYKHWHG